VPVAAVHEARSLFTALVEGWRAPVSES
jgi:hypothetical protein